MRPALHRSLASPLVALCLTAQALVAAAPEGVRWSATDRTLTARVPGWPLPRVLESLAGATGWRVYLDPALQAEVSAGFQRVPAEEGLRRLLGQASFALLPQTNGPTRLYVFRGSVQQATQLIKASAAAEAAALAEPIGHELIVRLKPGSKASIDAIAARLGARVVGRLDEAGAYQLRFDSDGAAEAARETLGSMDEVASVEDNFALEPPSRLQSAQGVQVPPLTLKPKVVPSAEFTVVALLDTGVAPANGTLKDFLLPTLTVHGESGAAPGGELTHGTAMAETIMRSVSQSTQDPAGSPVRVLPVDIYGGQPTTSTFDVVRGLYAVAEKGPDVINLSLGSDGDSPLLRETIQSLRDQGVMVVAAAGNEGGALPVYPAAYPEVLAVTASDRQGRLAPYANRGDYVDLIAPGTGLIRFAEQSYVGSGTSYSTALVSGAAAAQLATPGGTVTQAEEALRRTYAYQAPAPSKP